MELTFPLLLQSGQKFERRIFVMSILEVNGIKKIYTSRFGGSKVEALKNVTFSVEKGEYVTPSVVREIKEETGLVIEKPRLCGIKEFHRAKDGKRYIVFLYVANRFSGELKPSSEGDIFWYPLSELYLSDNLIDGFEEMLSVFTRDDISEVFYEKLGDDWNTVFC